MAPMNTAILEHTHMRRTLWSNGVSLEVIPVRLSSEHGYDTSNAPLRDIWAKPKCAEHVRKRVTITRKAGSVRDKSRKAVVQSGGYVTSGWAKQTKGGVSHVSRKVANQAVRKMYLG